MDFDEKEKRLNMGYDTVTISKEYGPTIHCDVRITADPRTCTWRIEREKYNEDESVTWEIMAEFDCQESLNFKND